MRWLILGIALLTCGCATQSGNFGERDRLVLEGRIDDLEAQSIRQKTKVANLEKQVSQLEDRLTMLSRRTSVDSREVVKIEPSNGLSASFDRSPTIDNDDVYQEIVISEEKKRSYFGTPRAKSNASASKTLQPYENVVTDEKLPAANADDTSIPSENKSAHASPMIFYQEGIDLYRQGNYEQAKQRFEQFLAAKPEESYIDNALYWIGECFYGEGLYNEAAGYFHKIVQEYPNANKVPDALLKVSLTYQKLGKLDSARDMLRYLMEAYPGTEAARIGKEKYETMRNAAQ